MADIDFYQATMKTLGEQSQKCKVRMLTSCDIHVIIM